MATRSESDFAPVSRDSRDPSSTPRHDSSRSRQLDFYQAMSDFKHMFPEMDEDVIEAVLRANNGAVDATIDQLLTMNIDNEELPNISSLQIFKDHKLKKPLEEPPPYSEAIKSNPPPRPARTRPPTESPSNQTQLSPSNRIHSSPNNRTQHSPSNQTQHSATIQTQPNLLDLDIGSFSSTLAASGHNHTTHKPLSKSNSEPKPETQPRQSPRSRTTTKKPAYKHYNPPLLGVLPDDFLRLTPPNPPERPHRPSPSISPNIHQSSSILHRSSSGVNRSNISRSATIAGTQPPTLSGRTVPSSHSHRSQQLAAVGRSHSQVVRHHSAHHHDRHRITPTDRSRSLTQTSTMPTHTTMTPTMLTRTITPSTRTPTSISRTPTSTTRSPTQTTVSHTMSSSMLQRKLRENEWRRKSAPTCEEDPETVQYLDDERMAIILQNREFLQELREDKDFMDTLNQDVTEEAEVKPEAEKVNTSPLAESEQEGYGEDAQDSLGAFPFTAANGQTVDDTELRQRLSNMGKDSKTHFASIAKKFFSIRKRKLPKPLTRDTVAPSMVNLLDEDYSNGDRDDPTVESDLPEPVDRPTRRYVSQKVYRPRITADTGHSSVL